MSTGRGPRERLLARAGLEALRAKIDPHFLFNALGAITELAHRDAARAEMAIGRLADVLRTSLSSDVETVALADEIGTVEEIRDQAYWSVDSAADLAARWERSPSPSLRSSR